MSSSTDPRILLDILGITQYDQEMIHQINQVFAANEAETETKDENNDGWNCRVCTFLNSPDDSKCGICGHAKSAENDIWTCLRCTYQNPPQSSRCLLCAASKPV